MQHLTRNRNSLLVHPWNIGPGMYDKLYYYFAESFMPYKPLWYISKGDLIGEAGHETIELQEQAKT